MRLILLLVAALLLPGRVFAADAPATEAQAEELMADYQVEPPKPTNPDFLDTEARMLTRLLGDKNPDWNDKNPAWSKVYEKIRADSANDKKPMDDYVAQQWGKDFAAVLSSLLTEKDADDALAFLRSPQGKNLIELNGAIKSSGNPATKTMKAMGGSLLSPDVSLSTKQAEKYARLLQSTQFCGTLNLFYAVIKKTPDYAMKACVKALVATVGEEKLDAFYEKYQSDLDSFRGFVQSDAGQKLFAVMTEANKRQYAKVEELHRAQVTAHNQHFPEWKTFYQHEALGQ